MVLWLGHQHISARKAEIPGCHRAGDSAQHGELTTLTPPHNIPEGENTGYTARHTDEAPNHTGPVPCPPCSSTLCSCFLPGSAHPSGKAPASACYSLSLYNPPPGVYPCLAFKIQPRIIFPGFIMQLPTGRRMSFPGLPRYLCHFCPSPRALLLMSQGHSVCHPTPQLLEHARNTVRVTVLLIFQKGSCHVVQAGLRLGSPSWP